MMTTNTSKENPRSYLSLVVGGSKYSTQDSDAINESFGNVQTDLFGKPDSILYVDVKKIGFTDFKFLVSKYSIHHILDLRDVPYLNFRNTTRKKLFCYLQHMSIDYLSLSSIASRRKCGSIDELLTDDRNFNDLSSVFSKWVGKKPTLILISGDKEYDPTTEHFSNILKRANIIHTEIAN